jgi:hypothetical protein
MLLAPIDQSPHGFVVRAQHQPPLQLVSPSLTNIQQYADER